MHDVESVSSRSFRESCRLVTQAGHRSITFYFSQCRERDEKHRRMSLTRSTENAAIVKRIETHVYLIAM